MSVRFVMQICDEFTKASEGFGGIQTEVSEPWHFNECRGTHPKTGNGHGIYLYTEPDDQDWNVKAADNDRAVWYVGRSAGDLEGRIWEHLRPIYDPETKAPLEPRFKLHRWRSVPDTRVAPEIKQRLATGDVVVYSICIDAEDPDPMLSELLEKYVLVRYVLRFRKPPVLNLQL